jgi:hypothetical protein
MPDPIPHTVLILDHLACIEDYQVPVGSFQTNVKGVELLCSSLVNKKAIAERN